MIVIFAHPRSGSNSLQEILETNRKINILREPFNTKSLRDWDPSLEPLMNVKDLKSLDFYLKFISKKYNGIKTLADELPFNLNINIITNPKNKVIMLSRKNLLKAAVSKLIGEKTDIWSVDKESINDYRNFMNKFNIGTLDLKKVGGKIKEFRKDIEIYKKILKKKRVKFFSIYHEELFDNSVSERKKMRKIKKIFKFLGHNEKLNIKEIKEILNPKNKNMTDDNIYLKIENIREIEKEFGSRKNGFIFKKTSKIRNFKNNLKSLIFS